MEIAAIVEFETNNAQDFNDKMVISIDNKEIDIPIHAFPAKPILVVDGYYYNFKKYVLILLFNFKIKQKLLILEHYLP
jgi:hypothetical protein